MHHPKNHQKAPISTIFILFACSALIILAALFYYPSLHYAFQFDDVANIQKHFHIRHHTFGKLFFSGTRWISYWLNSLYYAVGRFDPFVYRVGSVTIHTINSLLLFLLYFFSLSNLRASSFFKKNAPSIAWISALLFLLHPVQTQTVTYVIQGQLEGLAAMCILSMALCLLAFSRAHSRAGRIAYATLLFAIALISCGTKEIAIISPLLLLIFDWFFLAQGNLQIIKNRMPLYGALFGVVTLTYLYFLKPTFFTEILSLKKTATNNIGNVITHNPTAVITPGQFFISQFKVIVHYLLMFIWPFSISVEYDWMLSEHFFAPDCFLPFLLLASIMIGIFITLKKNNHHLIAFGMLWFFAAIAPRSSIIPSPELLVDYKTYTASFGWLFVLACAAVYAAQLLVHHLQHRIPARTNRYARYASVVMLALLLGVGTKKRNEVWSSGLAFWGNIIQNAPGKARAYNNYGVELSQTHKKFAESIPYFKRAIAMDSNYPDPCNNLAVAYSQTGQTDLAITALKRGLAINKYYPEGYNNLASFYLQKKEYAEAERILLTALKLRPHYGKAFFNLGRVYLEQDKIEQAWECFKNCCLAGDMDNEIGFSLYAKSSVTLKKYDDAIVAYSNMLKFNPRNVETIVSLANCYHMTKQLDTAVGLYQQALKMNPQEWQAWHNLAETYIAQRKFTDAIACFEKLEPVMHQFPNTFIRLAACYNDTGNKSAAKKTLIALHNHPLVPQHLKGQGATLLSKI